MQSRIISYLPSPHLHQWLQLNCSWWRLIYHITGGFDCFCQNCFPRPVAFNIALVLSNRVLFIHNATLFCCGVYVIVNCLLISSCWQKLSNSSMVYSPPLSILKHLIFFLDSSYTPTLKVLKTTSTSAFLLIGYTQHLLKKSYKNDTKYLATPKNTTSACQTSEWIRSKMHLLLDVDVPNFNLCCLLFLWFINQHSYIVWETILENCQHKDWLW